VMHTLLVANRGEIARRVIRAARGLGLRTVAVYTPPDAASPHVADADLAVPLADRGGYLDRAALLAAAAAAGADAVHPGYGFLAENADFAAACLDAGLVWVGPSPDVIRRMGIKDEAKAVAREAGVPVLADGGPAEDSYPVLVKAVAGGGGKGMRLVNSPAEMLEAVAAARREAASAFGDDRVFWERYLPGARHVEIQVFGDTHGNVVHLLERECSIQRRHQKIVEECPSPAVDAALRSRMGETAVALAKSLGYTGAGTVEFLLDADGSFYFLEMNTRLQVEHPVTEEVTGLDLVALQLRVAAGEPLPFGQAEVAARGHAIEVRLYAEDPARDWAPTFGPLWTYAHQDRPGLRYEDGAGPDVSTHYDPMLAKVIAHGASRAEAAGRLAAALAAMRLHGPRTNRDALVAILREPDFLAGRTRTDYLDRHPEVLAAGPDDTTRRLHLAAAVAVTAHRRAGELAGWRLTGPATATATWEPAGEVRYRLGTGTVEVDGEAYAVRDLTAGGVRIAAGGVERHCAVTRTPDGVTWVNDTGAQTAWREAPRFAESAAEATARDPVSDVPGTVTAVLVSPGDEVSAGQPLVLLEAMKMEHRVLAAAGGTVAEVRVEVGQYVDAHQVLVTFEGDA
jgi:propionyl-CoA carboxylase alpha chain